MTKRNTSMGERAGKTKAALLIGAAALITACTTVPVDPQQRPVPQRPGPVVTDPTQPRVPTPTDTDTKTPEETDTPDTPDVASPDNVEDIPDAAQPYFNNRDGLTLPHMSGRDTKRLALLLPFSAGSERLREEANAMFQAAELSLFGREAADVVLIPLDTKGTEAGARSAARAAMSQGADVILGPIIADNVKAATREARRSGTPVIAFSNDQTAAGNGAYLLSFPPEAEVERIVQHAASQGVTRYAFIGPDDAYGRRVRRAYDAAVRAAGGQITASETYVGNDISVMQAPAAKLAQFYNDAEARARANGGLTPRAFEAVLMPEGGTPLRSLAPLLPFNGVDPSDVMFMGTSRWDNDKTVREPALAGGVFAAADKDARQTFMAEFERAFGTEPSGLATLAYDAVRVGAYIADGDPKARTARTEVADGFYGVDGFVRFDSTGRPERGLAVYTIRGGSFRLLDPAPRGPAPEG